MFLGWIFPYSLFKKKVEMGRRRPAIHPKFLRRLEAAASPTQDNLANPVPGIPTQQERQPALPVSPTSSRGGEAKATFDSFRNQVLVLVQLHDCALCVFLYSL